MQRGDLAVSVPVDDASEVGLLQAGVNHMVDGLRERERLHDLFGRHVGVEVARNAIERGTRLGGEVRDVSALFVDLVGSTTLALLPLFSRLTLVPDFSAFPEDAPLPSVAPE